MTVLDVALGEPHVSTYKRSYDRTWCTDWESKHDLMAQLGHPCGTLESHHCPHSDADMIRLMRELPYGARFIVETRTGLFTGEVYPKDWGTIAEYLGVSEGEVKAVYRSALSALWPLLHDGRPAPAGQFDDERPLRKRKASRREVSPSTRFKVFEADGYRCRACGASASEGVTLHLDHIIPVSKGGTNDRDNLQTLCDLCNLGKLDRIVQEIPS